MEVTCVSSEGQIAIPKTLHESRHWQSGQELVAIEVGDGILLKPKKLFPETTLDRVAGCLKYRGQPKSLDEIENAICQGLMEQWHGRS